MYFEAKKKTMKFFPFKSNWLERPYFESSYTIHIEYKSADRSILLSTTNSGIDAWMEPLTGLKRLKQKK